MRRRMPKLEAFYEEYFNPYLNFHRPCGVPERVVNAKGKERRVYRWYATPWQILRQLPGLAEHLKPDITVADLGTGSSGEDRHGGRRADAGSQRKAICSHHAQEDGLRKNRRWKWRGHGHRGKPKAGFPRRPQPLGNRRRRDSHISTAATTRLDGKVEIRKQDSHFPTARRYIGKLEIQNQEKEAWRRIARSRLSGSSCVRIKIAVQAHPSMRICYFLLLSPTISGYKELVPPVSIGRF